ncbi:DUF6476 family protein [Pseudoponticoccus marisrubri]|uniref:Uncharacterized protein n=1 Tax=Pseudoponticoccus marisrubri TaxID=1685382 RepID=A0A0W7WKY5_9RHOB|nr:DUF6476 family protein [Pseudoponticoccus marisrubri]KUF11194.1 hypothetical protein AVJ23_09075 [Pseudoponticoccus marisrubri]
MSAPEPEDLPEPPSLRLLRVLVTVLTAVMIAGITGILGLIWHRYSNARAPLPEVITLPSGAEATAYTQGPDWYAVVTATDEILIFDRATGKLRQTLQIAPAP